MVKKKIVIASGGFDPLHAGHVDYLEAAADLGNMVIVGCNTDKWLSRKRGKPFMDHKSREKIVEALWCVDYVIEFDDSDGSASDLIRRVIEMMSTHVHPLCRGEPHFIFANGGDRTATNIPEMNQQYDAPVEFVFGVGGEEKLQSSSTLLKNWQKDD